MPDNDLLRAHVTRVGFDLTLGKTHIAALVVLNESLRQKRYIRTTQTPVGMRRTFAHFASGMEGCITRGLVVHHYNEKHRDDGLRWHYTITTAGKLVIGLLTEAGLYQEYADALPHLEVAS